MSEEVQAACDGIDCKDNYISPLLIKSEDDVPYIVVLDYLKKLNVNSHQETGADSLKSLTLTASMAGGAGSGLSVIR